MSQKYNSLPRPIAIAIVDDELSVRVGLGRLCQALGLEPTVHASGRAFLESLAPDAPCPDCLLLDAQMPDMTGIEVHQHLVDRGMHVPTLVYTGDDAPETHTRYFAVGVAGLLRKPIGADALLAAIDRAMNTRR
jgi:FixJ family two-component response regulator